jgi:hypothetical protein
MPQLRRAIILTSALALSAGAVVLKTTQAADERVPSTGAVAPDAPSAKAPEAANPGVAHPHPDPANPAQAKPPQAGAPQVPEESATIRDDPTVAPDPKQSADNNVSFPNDI